MDNEHSKRPSATKRGPGRFHKGGKPGHRLKKPHALSAYEALMAAWAQKRITNWKGMRDEHGAKTRTGRTPVYSEQGVLIGSERRVWLAGISAQRGY